MAIPSKWPFENSKILVNSESIRMAILAKWPNILTIFFVNFGQINVFYILAEFEIDVMRPKETTKIDERASRVKLKIFCQFQGQF